LVGEILCLYGVFQANHLLAILAVTTVILAAAYLLWMYRRVMHGPITNPNIRSFKDLNLREIGFLLPIIILMVWMGVYPKTFLRKFDASVAHYIQQVRQRPAVLVRSEHPPGRAVEKPKPVQALLPPEGSKHD